MGLDTKEKLKSYLQREQIVSVLNDTKWQKLFDCLKETDDYYLDFKRKDLDREAPESWASDLYEHFGSWHKTEWIDIRTDNDHAARLKAAIIDSGVPYSLNKGAYRTWGYLRPGGSPRWENT